MNTLKDFDVNLNSVNNDDGDDTSTYSLWTSATTVPCSVAASISPLSAFSSNWTVTGDPNYTESKC